VEINTQQSSENISFKFLGFVLTFYRLVDFTIGLRYDTFIEILQLVRLD